MQEISAQEIFARINKGEAIALIDVRSPAEFSALHAEGAINVPLDQLSESTFSDLSAGKSAVAFICKGGTRSKKACGSVSRDTLSIIGGTDAWAASGLPTVAGKGVISIERQVRIGAGAMVLLGVVGSLVVHPWLVFLSAFVGAGLIFAGVTDWCGMGLLLARMPWNQGTSDKSVGGDSCAHK